MLKLIAQALRGGYCYLFSSPFIWHFILRQSSQILSSLRKTCVNFKCKFDRINIQWKQIPLCFECASICFIHRTIWIFCPRAGGTFLTLLIHDCSFPTLWNLIKMFKNLSNPQPLPVYLHPRGTYVETVGAIKELFTHSDSFWFVDYYM